MDEVTAEAAGTVAGSLKGKVKIKPSTPPVKKTVATVLHNAPVKKVVKKKITTPSPTKIVNAVLRDQTSAPVVEKKKPGPKKGWKRGKKAKTVLGIGGSLLDTLKAIKKSVADEIVTMIQDKFGA